MHSVEAQLEHPPLSTAKRAVVRFWGEESEVDADPPIRSPDASSAVRTRLGVEGSADGGRADMSGAVALSHDGYIG
jgi:hypothetical protein